MHLRKSEDFIQLARFFNFISLSLQTKIFVEFEWEEDCLLPVVEEFVLAVFLVIGSVG